MDTGPISGTSSSSGLSTPQATSKAAPTMSMSRKPALPKRTLDAPDVFDMFDALHDETTLQYNRSKLRNIIHFRRSKKRIEQQPLPSIEYDSDEEIPEDVLMASYKQDIALLHHTLRHARRIVVISGAGISVAAGIPDFRSTTGLFRLLRNEFRLKGGVSSGQQMFDASHVFSNQQTLDNFHTTVCDLHTLCQQCQPTPFHELIDSISQDNRLLRLYTQNIDGLDTGLPHLATKHPLVEPWPKTVQLHGTITSMICSKCSWTADFDPNVFHNVSQDTPTNDDEEEKNCDNDNTQEDEEGYDSDNETIIEVPTIPECPECIEMDGVRAVAGKRSQGVGTLRPKIVLYNEPNPDAEAIGQITEQDLLKKPDALVVVGTSLKIPGVRRMVREMSQAVHAARGCSVWMNIDDPSALSGREFEACFDLIIKGDCQILPQMLCDYEEEKRLYEEEKQAQRKIKAEARAIRQKLALEKQVSAAAAALIAAAEADRSDSSIASRSMSEGSVTSSRLTSLEPIGELPSAVVTKTKTAVTAATSTGTTTAPVIAAGRSKSTSALNKRSSSRDVVAEVKRICAAEKKPKRVLGTAKKAQVECSGENRIKGENTTTNKASSAVKTPLIKATKTSSAKAVKTRSVKVTRTPSVKATKTPSVKSQVVKKEDGTVVTNSSLPKPNNRQKIFVPPLDEKSPNTTAPSSISVDS
ncbi:uncharacterized protein SAPINGB_P000267 [Magnusiomyces paraingens]|uniref:Deacetylase sirtuin-type domain-containing protein n=1 Tax=Magnusiomyces paraingens TaxID=2606893 RepID=A0A5E8B564_9ASCO|nr:uncharacterized protein SAPINGB_P000267 [Saprochaete ingens]VVT44030.1 unnamed protein product [Saprochaete ingens]